MEQHVFGISFVFSSLQKHFWIPSFYYYYWPELGGLIRKINIFSEEKKRHSVCQMDFLDVAWAAVCCDCLRFSLNPNDSKEPQTTTVFFFVCFYRQQFPKLIRSKKFLFLKHSQFDSPKWSRQHFLSCINFIEADRSISHTRWIKLKDKIDSHFFKIKLPSSTGKSPQFNRRKKKILDEKKNWF